MNNTMDKVKELAGNKINDLRADVEDAMERYVKEVYHELQDGGIDNVNKQMIREVFEELY